MRVALLSHNARAHDAVGNHVAETAAFFLDRGAAVRLFVSSAAGVHPALRGCTEPVQAAAPHGPVWDYLAGADLVIAQYAQAYDLLHFLPLLAGGRPRLVLDYHSVTPPALWPGPGREALEQGLRQRGIAWCADAVIVHSEFARRELIAATGLPADRVHRAPLVVDRERFRPGTSRFLHQRLGLGDVRLLLYVGRIAPNKRVPTLIEALAQMPDDVHAAIVGDASDIYAAEAERCRARARDLGVAGRVHFVGRLDDAELAEAYRSAAALVIPSRHEGCCVPVVEAMAAGLPVVAARAAALPETVDDAGLTFAADDAGELARRVQRLREPPLSVDVQAPRRVAVVCFRFGADIVGGAETSLRTIARTLRDAGHRVEVFATCTKSEGEWRNELPAGTQTEDGLTVHRFPVDAHDRAAHLEAVRTVVEAHGAVTPEQEAAYLRHSIHSTALVQELQRRAGDFDAVIAGPYLFGLTHDVAQALPQKTLLLPCFHDEPIARLAAWPSVYGQVGGMLLHSPEEKELALARLGVNHPTAVEVGTWIDATPAAAHAPTSRPYLVYCGRYSREKNLPVLLDWMRRYQQERPGRIDLVCLGRGELRLPRAPWLHDLGHVSEGRKRAVLAGARALVQLSRQESLSLVVLEAWAQAVPVIVHAECDVLAGQVQRSRGGITAGDYAAFARAVDEAESWRACGRHGRQYVEQHYASRDAFLTPLLTAIDDLHVPLRERMRRRGVERAALYDRAAWRAALGRIIEDLLDAAPRPYAPIVEVRPLHEPVCTRPGRHTALIPAAVTNRGMHAVLASGAGRTVVVAQARDAAGVAAGEPAVTELPALLVPGEERTAMLAVPGPAEPGRYTLHVWAEHPDGADRRAGTSTQFPLLVGGESAAMGGVAPLLDGVRRLLAEARDVQQLPDGYLDVTEGRFARCKRWVKHKLLNNFKQAYVDVLSRRQSHVNRQLVAAVQQLAECCATLDHAVRTLQRRLDAAAAPIEPEPTTIGGDDA